MKVITSSQNGLYKDLLVMRDRKTCEYSSTIFIEGLRFVEEAIKEKVLIISMIITQSFENTAKEREWNAISYAKESGTEIIRLSDALFNRLCDTKTPQGIGAMAQIKNNDLEDIMNRREHGVILILDSIKDPGNMGTMIRTADASGALGIISMNKCVDVFNGKVLRATMGAIFRMPIVKIDDKKQLFKIFEKNSIQSYATDLNSEKLYFDVDLTKKFALVIGNEASGIDKEVLTLCDQSIKIPMEGACESLNASVAAAVIMYEALRQRNL